MSIGVRPTCVSEPELGMQGRVVETVAMNVIYLKFHSEKSPFCVSLLVWPVLPVALASEPQRDL